MGVRNLGEREFQMMAILYTILQLPTQNPERPGAIYNYAGREDIEVDLCARDRSLTGNVSGRPRAH
jgi:hypothetical protein